MTGHEQYVTLMYTNPKAALAGCLAHIAALMQLQGARVSTNGVSVDPQTVTEAIKVAEQHRIQLSNRTGMAFQNRMIPTVRSDPWP